MHALPGSARAQALPACSLCVSFQSRVSNHMDAKLVVVVEVVVVCSLVKYRYVSRLY